MHCRILYPHSMITYCKHHANYTILHLSLCLTSITYTYTRALVGYCAQLCNHILQALCQLLYPTYAYIILPTPTCNYISLLIPTFSYIILHTPTLAHL